MSSESKNFHDGFFARIIRDALCTLPDAGVEQQPSALAQQWAHSVAEPDTLANAALNVSAQNNDATAITPVQENSPVSASVPAKFAAAATLPLFSPDRLSTQNANLETVSSTPATDKASAKLPLITQQLIAAAKPAKKVPLAITMRDPHTVKAPSQYSEMSVAITPAKLMRLSEQIATTQSLNVESPAVAVTAHLGRATVDVPQPDSPRETLRVAQQPVIAESAPVIAVHHLPERKTPSPALRIGAVTIRVIDVVQEQAVANRIGQPVKSPLLADPITNAESRHFLRTL